MNESLLGFVKADFTMVTQCMSILLKTTNNFCEKTIKNRQKFRLYTDEQTVTKSEKRKKSLKSLLIFTDGKLCGILEIELCTRGRRNESSYRDFYGQRIFT